MQFGSSQLGPSTRPQPMRRVLSGETMGTRYSAVFYCETDVALNLLSAELQAAVNRVDKQMSPWKPASVPSRLNTSDPGTWIDLPRETFEVVREALEVNGTSDGAFDPFVGDLVTAWGFGPASGSVNAAAAQRLQADWSSRNRSVELDLDGRRLRRLSDADLDLCGIAKGYGVDCLSTVLTCWGLTDHLVSIDGELRASGAKPDGTLWQVALEQPDPSRRSEAFTLELADAAIATSGTYRHRRITETGEVSHTMDPQTGSPLDNDLLSVTVLADTCMAADAWATAFMVMGAEQALPKARQLGLDAIFLRRNLSGGVDLAATDPKLLPPGKG